MHPSFQALDLLLETMCCQEIRFLDGILELHAGCLYFGHSRDISMFLHILLRRHAFLNSVLLLWFQLWPWQPIVVECKRRQQGLDAPTWPAPLA
jgi:hypothetical protein